MGYEKDFWHYAKQTEYYADILKIKENYSSEDMARDAQQFEALAQTASRDTDLAKDTDYVLPLRFTVKIPAKV